MGSQFIVLLVLAMRIDGFMAVQVDVLYQPYKRDVSCLQEWMGLQVRHILMR